MGKLKEINKKLTLAKNRHEVLEKEIAEVKQDIEVFKKKKRDLLGGMDIEYDLPPELQKMISDDKSRMKDVILLKNFYELHHSSSVNTLLTVLMDHFKGQRYCYCGLFKLRSDIDTIVITLDSDNYVPFDVDKCSNCNAVSAIRSFWVDKIVTLDDVLAYSKLCIRQHYCTCQPPNKNGRIYVCSSCKRTAKQKNALDNLKELSDEDKKMLLTKEMEFRQRDRGF